MVGDEAWKELEYAEVIDDDFLPEIGSRVFGNIFVVQLDAQNIDTVQKTKINVCMLDWTDIQNGYYKYQVFFREEKIHVKIIFNDFLYAEVVFARET